MKRLLGLLAITVLSWPGLAMSWEPHHTRDDGNGGELVISYRLTTTVESILQTDVDSPSNLGLRATHLFVAFTNGRTDGVCRGLLPTPQKLTPTGAEPDFGRWVYVGLLSSRDKTKQMLAQLLAAKASGSQVTVIVSASQCILQSMWDGP